MQKKTSHPGLSNDAYVLQAKARFSIKLLQGEKRTMDINKNK